MIHVEQIRLDLNIPLIYDFCIMLPLSHHFHSMEVSDRDIHRVMSFTYIHTCKLSVCHNKDTHGALNPPLSAGVCCERAPRAGSVQRILNSNSPPIPGSCHYRQRRSTCLVSKKNLPRGLMASTRTPLRYSTLRSQ